MSTQDGQTTHRTSELKPKGGLQGLRHAKHDLLAGFQVALLALSFSLGIAQASGVAPVAGLVTIVTMGFAASILALTTNRGPYLTICGAAAGLTTIIAGTIEHFSGPGWDPTRAFGTLCALGCLSGLIQITLAKCKLAGRIGGLFPATVIHAMLAAIGAIIIVKQLAPIMGLSTHGHTFWEMIYLLPEEIQESQKIILVLSLICLALVFALDTKRAQSILPVPAVITIVVLGSAAGFLLHIHGAHLVSIPTFHPQRWFAVPDFANLGRDPAGSLSLLAQLTLVGTIEAVATGKAIDGKDVYGRKTSADALTLGIGLANTFGAFLGAIPGIPGGVKSGANAQAGARTQWSAFFCAAFMLVFMAFGRPVVNLIPKAVLATVLIYIGWRLCKPAVWQHAAYIGREQLIVFATTFFTTISTDLLVGIGVGILSELVVTAYFVKKYAEPDALVFATLVGFWRNPVEKIDFQPEAGMFHIHLAKHVTAFNHRYLTEALAQAPKEATAVKMHFRKVTLVDHTAAVELRAFAEEVRESGRDVYGYERAMDIHLKRISLDPTALRVRPTVTP